MHRDRLMTAVLLAALVVFAGGPAYAEEFFARLNGFQEIGAQNAETGAILTSGTGTHAITRVARPVAPRAAITAPVTT